MMNEWYGYGYGSGWMHLGSIMWIILWWVVLYFVIRWLREHRSMGHNKTPLDIIKERYAKWEITKEELEKMKKDLAA